jgi:hypothetical protein
MPGPRTVITLKSVFDTHRIPADTSVMRTRIVLAMALAATLVSPAAPADEWISISKTSDSHATETFLDLSSIPVTDNIRAVRTKSVLLSPRNDNERRIAFGLQPMAFDCRASLVQAGSVEIHYTGTERLGFIDTHKYWKPADDPLTKKMFDLVCEWKPTTNSKKEDFR